LAVRVPDFCGDGCYPVFNFKLHGYGFKSALLVKSPLIKKIHSLLMTIPLAPRAREIWLCFSKITWVPATQAISTVRTVELLPNTNTFISKPHSEKA